MTFSTVSFLEDLGYTRCRRDPDPTIKAMVDAGIKCLSNDRAIEQIFEETIPESHASLGALEGHNLPRGQIRPLRLDVEVGQSSKSLIIMLDVACETRHWADQISAYMERCDRAKIRKVSHYKKPLM